MRKKRPRDVDFTRDVLEQLAKKTGGYTALGREFGVSGWAVQKWGRLSRVPPERVVALVEICERHGIAADPCAIRPDVFCPS